MTATTGRPFSLRIFFLLAAVAATLPPEAGAEQASQPAEPAAGRVDAGRHHTCAVLSTGAVRCWGFSAEGALGVPGTTELGDDESPSVAQTVQLGAGRTAVAVAAGDFHTCALLNAGSVRCWGFGGDGRLGYAGQADVGDNEDPGSVGPVNLGAGRTAKAITAGGSHTCAILDDDTLRCWGYGFDGQLGYGDDESIGDDVGETPATVGPVPLGSGRTVRAVAAGSAHTCAVLDNGAVRCWGAGLRGQLGYANTSSLGNSTTPDMVSPVNLGSAANAISAGFSQSCALLDGGSVRCWGYGATGRLGYGNTESIGDNEAPATAGPVFLGAGRTATAIAVGGTQTCARLDDDSVRCWGLNPEGQLGIASTRTIGDDETPGSVPPVDLGRGRSALAIALGDRHSCARLEGPAGDLRCWGWGSNGRLGYCDERNVGDDETPGSTGPVGIGDPASQAPPCPAFRGSPHAPRPLPPIGGSGGASSPLAAEATRRRAYLACSRRASRHLRRELRRARRSSGRARARMLLHVRRHRVRLRRACARRHGSTPGRVRGLRATAVSGSRIVLSFSAPGTDGQQPPAARAYVIKQSRRPIRGARAFRRAQALCGGRCRFGSVTRVGASIELTVTDLRPRTTYHYAVAARDNVSGRLGPRSGSAQAKTR